MDKVIKFLLPLALLGLVNCTTYKKQDLYPSQSGSCALDTVKTVSFSKNIIPIFKTNCSYSGCHDDLVKAGSLDLDSADAYTSLMKRGTGYVNTSNPQASLLYSQLLSASQPMPPTGRLSDCDLQLIQVWMQQGAENN